MSAAVEEAHRRGKKVCAHCSCLDGARALIEAGVDSIEHGIVLDEDAVRDMVARNVWLVPSLKCTAIEGESGTESGIPAFVRDKARQIYRTQMQSFQWALAAGVSIAAGTDAGPEYLPLGRESLVLELAQMVDLGMTPLAAIESCTRHAAGLLGVADELGTLEPGKLADMIVVDGDPLAEMTALNAVRCVIKGGAIVETSLD
jgi:imidazolonepropionase-like amidohydrolase